MTARYARGVPDGILELGIEWKEHADKPWDATRHSGLVGMRFARPHRDRSSVAPGAGCIRIIVPLDLTRMPREGCRWRTERCDVRRWLAAKERKEHKGNGLWERTRSPPG
jgi:hypothetical protein